MTADELERFEREAYRAIGRYVVEFSVLISWMRTLVAERLAPDPPILAELALGEASANNIANTFFGTCRQLSELNQGERKVASRLRTRVVRDVIEQRNDVAHGDWFVEAARFSRVKLGSVEVVRVRPMRKEGAIKSMSVSAQQLDEWSDAIAALRFMVAEFGAICIGAEPYKREGVRVRDVFVMQSGEVVRAGPRAKDFPAYDQ